MVRLSLSAGAGGSAAEAIFWRPAETPGWRRYTGTVALGPLWKRRVSSVEFRAIDRAGNRSLVARFAFRIDDVAPDLPPLRVGRYQTGRRPGTFVGSEGIFVPPFEPGAILEYRLDDGDFTPCQIGQTIRPPSDGVFTITFRIRDELGNSQSRTFRIKTDSTPPKTTIRFD